MPAGSRKNGNPKQIGLLLTFHLHVSANSKPRLSHSTYKLPKDLEPFLQPFNQGLLARPDPFLCLPPAPFMLSSDLLLCPFNYVAGHTDRQKRTDK